MTLLSRRSPHVRSATIAVLALGLAVSAAPPAAAASAAATTSAPAVAPLDAAALPVVTPAPQSLVRSGTDTALPAAVTVVVGADTDASARRDLEQLLRDHGVKRVTVTSDAPADDTFVIRLGDARRSDIAQALGETTVPTKAEGYALRVDGASTTVALGGVDAAGQFYAVQTLRQIIRPGSAAGRAQVSGVAVSDFPSMPLRGSIEGFYGAPWTHAERLDQVAFYGDMKANTYIYAPKDDPFHRERWREPYPADKLAELTELVKKGADNHVRFTFALSPGNTICYSSDADVAAITTKFEQMYAAGVRAFNIPLDDISLSRWHCAADGAKYGPANAPNGGRAQADFLSRIQREFIETHEGAQPLQMVPTEYYNSTESGYKQALRGMDEDVIVMWTGNDVVPQSISVAQAKQAATVFGGPTFLWDNYPVNDYGNTAGRLLLAPYTKREAGLSQYLAGIVSNPMNQAAASKIAVTGVADFTWNDMAYDAQRSWAEAMRYLADDDEQATAALTVFADLNHLAPTFGAPWQPQAPALRAKTDAFWSAWTAGRKAEAIAELRSYAVRIAGAPGAIRGGSVDPAFVSDAGPWLDATAKWGQATLKTLDALQARLDGDAQGSSELAAESDALAAAAAAVTVDPPDNSWGGARVKIADGVLDVFLVRAGLTLDLWEAGDVENVAPQGRATASSVEQNLARFTADNVNDGDDATRWASGYTDDEWVQVQLAQPSEVAAVTVSWEAACATAYKIQTSVDGQTWTTVKDLTESTCALDVITLPQTGPVSYVRMQGVDRKTTWGYSIWELGIYAPR